MAHCIGLRTVAEGIEHTEQNVTLGVLGCQEGQGYLFCKPRNAEDTTAWLTATTAPKLAWAPV